MISIKDMNCYEKILFTSLGWHYGMMQNKFLILFYFLGIIAIPLGAIILPHYMIWPPGVKVPRRFLKETI